MSSIPPMMPPPGPSDTVVYLTAFDNVGAFGQQGVPAAAMLRAHLHRAMLVGERIAVGVHFLLNCRPFLCEVLLRSGGSSSTGSASGGGATASGTTADGSSGIQLEEAYLHYLCPVLPVRQVVDRGAAGGGKVTVELQADPHPLLACRRECQLGNPAFLAERIDEALIAAVDRFYTASPERRALIRWYDVGAVGGTYASWLHALASDAEATAPVFEHPAEQRAAAAALPPTAAFVEACLGKFSVNPVASASSTHTPATAPPGTGYLTRSLMYKWADLFRYPTIPADFAKGCGPQLAALNAHGPGTKAEAQVRAAAAEMLGEPRDGLSDCVAAASTCSDSCGGAQPLSDLLLRVRGTLVERPWRYGGVLRLLSDAPYITALPLSPALSLSLVVDGEREQSVVALSRLALGLVAAREAGAAAAAAADRSRASSASGLALGTGAAPASGTSSGAAAAGSHASGGSVRVLDPLSVTSDLRATELARLPVSEVIALRGHPAAVAFRAAVARLRRLAGRRILGGAADGRGPLSPVSVSRLPSCGGRDRGGSSDAQAASVALTPPATPLLSRAHSGSGGVSAGGGFAGADSEETLACAALAAAEAFCALLRNRLVPVDQQALPQLSLEALPAADAALHKRVAALRASLNASGSATRSCTVSSGTCADADSSRSSAPAGGLACSPHLPPAVWQALRAGVTVCKGDPIPPTFNIPRIAFPALVPVVRAAAALPGSAAAAAATVSRQLSGHSKHLEAPTARSAAAEIACGAPPVLVEVAAAESLPAGNSSTASGTSAGAIGRLTSARAGIGQQGAAEMAGAMTTVIASAAADCPSAESALTGAETEGEDEDAHPVRCLEPITAYSEPANKWVTLRFDRVRFPSGAVGRHNVVVEFGARAGRPGVCILPITPDRHILFLKQYRYPVREWSWEIPRGGPELGRSPLQQAIAELEEETGYTVQYRSGEAAALAGGVAAANGAAAVDSTAPLAVELSTADLPAGARPRMLQLAAGAAAADSRPRSAPEGVSAASGSNASPRTGFTESGVGLLWPNTGISDTVCAFFAAVDVVPLPSGSRREVTEAIERVQPVPVEDCYEMVRSGAIRDQFTIAALGLGILHGLLPPPGDALL
jgi:8-oxo-dGTP pyrophosphatase MutT (NUDIX family)